MQVMSHLTLGLDGIFGLWLRAQNRPVIQSAIPVLLDPAARVDLQPFQPHARVAGIEKALLEVSDTAAQLAPTRHTHVLLKLATHPRHGKIKPGGRQHERELVRQAEP